MLRCHSRTSKQIHSRGSILCRRCRNQVACVRGYIRIGWQGIFNRVFNVNVACNYDFHLQLLGIIIASTFCSQCGVLLGWKILEITRRRQNMLLRQGRFLKMLHKLCTWHGEPLLRLNQLPHVGANQENADQDGDAIDEDGDENEQNPDQDGVRNEENADQDGVHNEENADQDGVRNEENVDQDGGSNEQNADQDGVHNEENADQDMESIMRKMPIKMEAVISKMPIKMVAVMNRPVIKMEAS